ncbi:hypothetical protein NKW56_13490, partial [Acetobacter cerevisiae]|nr:hypothetical protein [Acetobacter cerevisiae]MCP1279568.1 hypothetical protein [Acetobacter cerevisiae]
RSSISKNPGCFIAKSHQQTGIKRIISALSNQGVFSWLEKHPASRNQDYIKPAGRDIMKQVDEILDYANDVSQPDN